MVFDPREYRDDAPPLVEVTEAETRGASHINLRSVTPISPLLVKARAMDPVTGAGVRLTRCVLIILSLTLAVLIGASIWQEYEFNSLLASALNTPVPSGLVQSNGSVATAQQTRADFVQSYQEITSASREFWIKLDQMILLNLLLPVLTALLGYVFASRQGSR